MSGSLQRDDQLSWGSFAGLSEHITLENNMDYSVLQCSVDSFISHSVGIYFMVHLLCWTLGDTGADLFRGWQIQKQIRCHGVRGSDKGVHGALCTRTGGPLRVRQGAVLERTLAVYVGQGARGDGKSADGGPYSRGSGLLELN